MNGDGEQDDRHRWQGPGSKPARHPKMKPYDDGGLVDLVKAIAVNLKEERAAKAKEKYKPKTISGRDKHRPRRHDRSRCHRDRNGGVSKSTGHTEIRDFADDTLESLEHPKDPDAENEAPSEGQDEPPVDADQEQTEGPENEGDLLGESAQAEIRQHEEIDAANARDLSLHDDNEHQKPYSSHSSISSMPPEIDVDSSGNPPGSTVLPTNSERHASVETDDERSDSRDSGDESDHSTASTKATVPSSNNLSPQSGPSSGRGRGGRRERRSGLRGGGADCDDNEEESYNLHEAYDDEYDHSEEESPPIIIEEGRRDYKYIDIGAEFYHINEDSDAEPAQKQPPKAWASGPPNGMPRSFKTPTGRSGSYAEGSRTQKVGTVWLDGAVKFVTVTDYYQATRPSTTTAPAPSHSTRQQASRSTYRPRPTGGTSSSRTTYTLFEESRTEHTTFSSRPKNPYARSSNLAGGYRDSARAPRSPPPSYSSRQNRESRVSESESESDPENDIPQPTGTTNDGPSHNYKPSKEKSKTKTRSKNKKYGKQTHPSSQLPISDSDSEIDIGNCSKSKTHPSRSASASTFDDTDTDSLSDSDSDYYQYSHPHSAHPPNFPSSDDPSARNTHSWFGNSKAEPPSSDSDTSYHPKPKPKNAAAPPPSPQSEPAQNAKHPSSSETDTSYHPKPKPKSRKQPPPRHGSKEGEKAKGDRDRGGKKEEKKKETYTPPIPTAPTDYYAVIGVSPSATAAE